MNKREGAAKKTALILKSTYKAFIEKKFSESSFKYEVSEITDPYLEDTLANYKGSSIQKNLLKLSIELTDYASGIVFITSNNTLVEIQALINLNSFHGPDRISVFSRVCKDNDLDFNILFDTTKIYNKINKSIQKLSKKVIKIVYEDCQDDKMTLLLEINNKDQLTFKFSYQETDSFLEALFDFEKKVEEKSFSKNNELYTFISKTDLIRFLIVKKNRLFKNNDNIHHIILPEGIKEIPEYLFANCTNLKSVVIPESVEIIRCGAFMGCENLYKINFPINLKKIEKFAFADCDSLLQSANFSKNDIPENCRLSKNAFAPKHDLFYYHDLDYDCCYDDENSWLYYTDKNNWY